MDWQNQTHRLYVLFAILGLVAVGGVVYIYWNLNYHKPIEQGIFSNPPSEEVSDANFNKAIKANRDIFSSPYNIKKR